MAHSLGSNIFLRCLQCIAQYIQPLAQHVFRHVKSRQKAHAIAMESGPNQEHAAEFDRE